MSMQHPHEERSNQLRQVTAQFEPRALRTFTPSQAVLDRSAGVFHWTPEGKRLYDFSSGVLVANLGHNPVAWTQSFLKHMGISEAALGEGGFFKASPYTAYNAITPLEVDASRELVKLLRSRPGGAKMEQAFWAASGSEAIQKALWTAMARDRNRDMILATRHGFHGKKGLANAVTGSETDRERDPRVRFISFPRDECIDLEMREKPFDITAYRKELEDLWNQFGPRIGTLITEPYLGGGGSFHPPKAYLPMLQSFCRDHDMVFILDEVQSNFGRTGAMFAFETYGIEPDLVVLGKGLGNGVPVAATVGSAYMFSNLDYGEGSDTWSANPLCCAAVLATLEVFTGSDVIGSARHSSGVIEAGLTRLKRFPFVAHVRGEKGGMVWGVETKDWSGKSAPEWANAIVHACYIGNRNDGIHLLGPLAKKVVRIAPPLVITTNEATHAMQLMEECLAGLASAAR